jgi:hypothetical protein
VQVRIETDLPVSPAVFWPRIFLNAEFGKGLHERLGFSRYAVVSSLTRSDGCIERVIETEPPLSGPEVIQKRVGRALRVTERGCFDPRNELYTFTHTPALAGGSTRITGTIRVAPRPHGLVQIVEFDVVVSAFGLGTLIERAIEKATRESYATMGAFTAEFAAAQGLLHTA